MNAPQSLNNLDRKRKIAVDSHYSVNNCYIQSSVLDNGSLIHGVTSDTASLTNHTSTSSSISTSSSSSLHTYAAPSTTAPSWLPPISSLLCHSDERYPKTCCTELYYKQADYYYCYNPTFLNEYGVPSYVNDAHTNHSLNDTYSCYIDNVNNGNPSTDTLYRKAASDKKAAYRTFLSVSGTRTGIDNPPYILEDAVIRPVKRNRTARSPFSKGEQQHKAGAALPIIPFFFHHGQFGIEACMLQLDHQKQQHQQKF